MLLIGIGLVLGDVDEEVVEGILVKPDDRILNISNNKTIIIDCYDYSNNFKKDSDKGIIKAQVEQLLFKMGFEKTKIRLNYAMKDGLEEIECYSYKQMHCLIGFMPNYTMEGKLKDWVVIEYADSLYEAQRWMFEDGDPIPIDIATEQIMIEIEQELAKVIKRMDLTEK